LDEKATNCIHKGLPIETAKCVDPLDCWEGVGMVKFPRIAQTAMIQLCVPDSSGYQERVFSKCSYFNTHQRRNMVPKNFEMQTLLSMNRCFAEQQFEEKLKVDVDKHEADKESEITRKAWRALVASKAKSAIFEQEEDSGS
jgi:hypothetical protein